MYEGDKQAGGSVGWRR